MSRCTVIGASGFVGARLVEALTAAGREVSAPSRDHDGLFTRDLGQVFYCAGLTADYLARPFDTVEAHVGLIARILRDARFERLVYLSSTRLYDWMGAGAGREGVDPADDRVGVVLRSGVGDLGWSGCLTLLDAVWALIGELDLVTGGL